MGPPHGLCARRARRGVMGGFPRHRSIPAQLYKELRTASARKNIHAAADFVTLAKAGKLPPLVYAWSPDGSDEHPPSKAPDPGYIRREHDLVWQCVDARVKVGNGRTLFSS